MSASGPSGPLVLLYLCVCVCIPIGYLIHIFALNMLNILSSCFKSMPWPDVHSKKTSPDTGIRKCQIN